MSQFIVIERWPDWENATIVTDPDTFINKVFDTYAEAEAEAKECQNGIVVGDDIIEVYGAANFNEQV